MQTTITDKKMHREVIARFRKVTEARPQFSLVHERQRKTTTRPEVNTYSLMRGALPVVTLNTTTGEAEWTDELRIALGVQA